jgi:hypothetical protein
MMIANAAMNAALWAGVMLPWSQIAEAIKPNANPATPATKAPTKHATKNMSRSIGKPLGIPGLAPQLLQVPHIARGLGQ